MDIYLRATSAIASVFIIAACSATAGGAKPEAARSSALAQDPTCAARSGSPNAVMDTNCWAMGRSYSSDDIIRTGATTIGEALQLMDPSITVRR